MPWSRFTRTRGHLRRLREIVVVLVRHGFSHVLDRMRLSEYAPWARRLLTPAAPLSEDSLPPSLADQLAAAMEELGPAFVKFGQLLATRPDLVADDFIQAFARLQDRVAPMAPADLEREITAAFGRGPEEVFAFFDRAPLACGSIAQVHAARLKDGREIVLKVKRPDIDAAMREDLRLLAGLARLVDQHLPEYRPLRPEVLVEEFARGMERELDFSGEAALAERLGRDLAAVRGLKVPGVFWDYVTTRTLAYERLPGVTLARLEAEDRRAAGLDAKRLSRELAAGFMRQYFVTGLFHADPHPGNLIALPDGRLGLVDFGQMGRIPADQRRRLALLAAALGKGEGEFAADLCVDLGEMASGSDPEGFHRGLVALIDRYEAMPVGRLDFKAALNQAMRLSRTHGILFPRELALLFKSLATLLGVVQRLDPELEPGAAMRPFVRQALGGALDPARLPRRLGQYIYRLYSLLRRAPEDMRALLRKTREGNLRIIFSHEGLEPVTTRLVTAINRLTAGMVVSAIVVGSAVVLAAGGETERLEIAVPFLGRYPLSIAIAGVGFVFAMLIGLWMALGGPRRK